MGDVPGLNCPLPLARTNMNPCNPANSSVPLLGGGDTHIHPFGKGPDDFTITTRIPVGRGFDPVSIHNGPKGDSY